jgi:hypothetical protein
MALIKFNSVTNKQPFSFFMVLFLLSACSTAVPENKNSTPKPSESRLDNQEFGEVIGTVYDETGKPLVEAGVAVTKGTAPFPEILMVTDQQGRYRWGLPAGKFTLAVTQDHYKQLAQEVEVKKGQTVQLDFKLQK